VAALAAFALVLVGLSTVTALASGRQAMSEDGGARGEGGLVSARRALLSLRGSTLTCERVAR
jgi:hypothetical protein